MTTAGIVVGLMALAGHPVLWIALVNRLHGVGLPRPIVSLLSACCYALCVAIPLDIAWEAYQNFAGASGLLPFRLALWQQLYVLLAAAVAVVHFPRWAWRRWLAPPPLAVVRHHVRSVDIAAALGRRPVAGTRARLFAHIPGNRMLHLDVDEEEVALPRLPAELDGLSILHLSDFHISGRIEPAYFHQVTAIARDLAPDLIAITGDICDMPAGIDWIADIFGPLTAPLGKYFVLGNHDLRVKDVPRLRAAMEAAGCIDASRGARSIAAHGQTLYLAGNERPWFDSPEPQPPGAAALKIALCHTPDQLGWARRLDFDLMLAGHTHGGQVCLPGVGPVVCPSVHGVRFAGGTYFVAPTLMHVSRGVSNLFPLRLLCPPEMTKLVLRSGQLSG